MDKSERPQRAPLRGWFRQYVLGLGIGVLSSLYGLLALVLGRTVMPGFGAGNHVMTGWNGAAMAGAYLTGGLYLVLRWFLEKRLQSPKARGELHAVQVMLLVGFIATLVYVLLNFRATH